MTLLEIAATEEVVQICRSLLRINTSNDGDHPEQSAAEYVADLLAEVGVEPVITQAKPGRTNVLGRVPGLRPGPALLVHAHLDTVPADASEWQVHPLSGELRDGYLWGLGAVDMKGMVAMTLAAVRELLGLGNLPTHDIILAFVAGGEDDGLLGARHVVRHHRDLFEGCTDAIGEIGGFSVTLPTGGRLYPIQVAEKGIHRIKVTARSATGDPDPVVTLCEAVERIGKHRFPSRATPITSTFLDGLEELFGQHVDVGGDVAAQLGEVLPGLAPLMSASFRDTAAPTKMLSDSDYPRSDLVATAMVDGRFLPGRASEFDSMLRELAGPKVQVDVLRHISSVEAPQGGLLYEKLGTALRTFDPSAVTIPYMPSVGTDAKWFSAMGIRCFGFTPLCLPQEFNYAQMFHGVNERVPVSSLQFGAKVLTYLFGGPRVLCVPHLFTVPEILQLDR